MQALSVETRRLPEWLRPLVKGGQRPDLWVAFHHAPEVFSRVERFYATDAGIAVYYEPMSTAPISAVAAYRLGADGEAVDLMTGRFDRADGRQKRETPHKPRTAKKRR